MSNARYSSESLGLFDGSLMLPELPWAFRADDPLAVLEPHVSRPLLDLHYNTLHRGYVERTLANLRRLAPRDQGAWNDLNAFARRHQKDASVFADATQAWNHAFFWRSMWPNQRWTLRHPVGALRRMIERERDVESLRRAFVDAGSKLIGSGWVFLVETPDQRVAVATYKNTDNPLVTLPRLRPLAVCDVWEHAYLCDHGADRALWLDHFIRYLWSPTFSSRLLSPHGSV